MAYKGMKWLKCDLHMHTPIDTANWLGTTADDKNAIARLYAMACHEAGLDIIAITDHNFLSKDFIPLLQDALKNIEREFSHRITLFPGFELEAAGVGRGVHVIGLFEPNMPIDQIDATLTECGVGVPRIRENGRFEKSQDHLNKILHIVQNTHKGLVILPHCMSNEGLFDNNNISEWLQQDQFTLSDLLAVEVPKPVSKMSQNFQKLFRSGNDCDLGWKRIRPIATLMFSDCKKLQEFDANLIRTPNSIGFRYSWIKMSEPSIEALRQAFLDHDSRIILPDDVNNDTCPGRRNQIAKIKSIAIKNVAFLADQDIEFSANMNTLIGGRGCGKSTILEYLRIIFNHSGNKSLDKSTVQKVDRIKGTLSSTSDIMVHWENADGVSDTLLFENGSPSVKDRELTDSQTFFDNLPVVFFSQQQLNHLTEAQEDGATSVQQSKRLLDLIDGFVKSDLDEYANEEKRIADKVANAFLVQKTIYDTMQEKKKHEQAFQELDRQWKAHREIEADAKRHNILSLEKKYISNQQSSLNTITEEILSVTDKMALELSDFSAEESIHGDKIKEFESEIKTAKILLSNAVRLAVAEFKKTIDDFKTKDESWSRMEKECAETDMNFRKACEDHGLSPDAVGHLQEINTAREKQQQDIDSCQQQIDSLSKDKKNPDIVLAELYEVWKKQHDKRLEAAEKGNQLAVLSGPEQPFIKITTEYLRDSSSFQDCWQSFSPDDKRKRLGKNWEEYGLKLYELFKHGNAYSPWELIRDDRKNAFVNISKELGSDSKELHDYISQNVDRWHKLLVLRVHDSIDLKLYREDGTEAGSIAAGSLSDGQRNTAVLALLLAQNGGPLIIDQPEDELDSNFVFKELIPMLRRIKNKRQIIMATHNANLPVNGDAELVYALEVRNGRGVPLSQGGLDQQPVTKAVLDIMEGSEEAFRKRREKYHF